MWDWPENDGKSENNKTGTQQEHNRFPCELAKVAQLEMRIWLTRSLVLDGYDLKTTCTNLGDVYLSPALST